MESFPPSSDVCEMRSVEMCSASSFREGPSAEVGWRTSTINSGLVYNGHHFKDHTQSLMNVFSVTAPSMVPYNRRNLLEIVQDRKMRRNHCIWHFRLRILRASIDHGNTLKKRFKDLPISQCRSGLLCTVLRASRHAHDWAAQNWERQRMAAARPRRREQAGPQQKV